MSITLEYLMRHEYNSFPKFTTCESRILSINNALDESFAPNIVLKYTITRTAKGQLIN